MAESKEAIVPKFSRRNIYFATAIVNCLFVGIGLVMGWASPSVPKLREEQRNFTEEQYGLLSSLPVLAPGNLIVIFGLDTIGRRCTLLVCWISIFVSPLIMAFSKHVNALLAARFISGWGFGAGFTVIGVYISEIADVGVRSALNSSTYIFLSVGVIISFSVGPFVPFEDYNLMCLALTSVFGLFYYFLPESPYYLVSKERFDEARSTVAKLRLEAPDDLIDDELETIKFGIEEERANRTSFWHSFKSKAFCKQFLISLYVLYLQAGTALDPLTAYSEEIFTAAQLSFNAAYVPIAMTLWSICVSVPSPFFFKMFGTKPLLLFGGFGSGIGLALLGLNFVALDAGYDLSGVKYLPIMLDFLIYAAAFSGMGGCIWGIVSELFSPSVKALATGVCGLYATFLSFIFIQVFGEMKIAYGIGPAFVLFGAIQTVASIGLFFMKDTSKMTLQEIQDHFGEKTTPLKERKISTADMKI